MEKAMIPGLDLSRLRRWVDARNAGLPERAQGLIRYELDVTYRTPSSSAGHPGDRSTDPSGPGSRLPAFVTPRREGSGRSTGVTATSQ